MHNVHNDWNIVLGVIGIIVALVNIFGGIVIALILKMVGRIQLEIDKANDRVEKLEISVHRRSLISTETFVTKTEFNKTADKIFQKLDDIHNRLDGKADR